MTKGSTKGLAMSQILIIMAGVVFLVLIIMAIMSLFRDSGLFSGGGIP